MVHRPFYIEQQPRPLHSEKNEHFHEIHSVFYSGETGNVNGPQPSPQFRPTPPPSPQFNVDRTRAFTVTARFITVPNIEFGVGRGSISGAGRGWEIHLCRALCVEIPAQPHNYVYFTSSSENSPHSPFPYPSAFQVPCRAGGGGLYKGRAGFLTRTRAGGGNGPRSDEGKR